MEDMSKQPYSCKLASSDTCFALFHLHRFI